MDRKRKIQEIVGAIILAIEPGREGKQNRSTLRWEDVNVMDGFEGRSTHCAFDVNQLKSIYK